MAKSDKKKLKQKLFHKHSLVILDEDTLEESFSLQLNLMNVFVVVSLSSILLIALTTVLIAFTPLRQYIPGYATTSLKKDAMSLAIKSDSLEHTLSINNAYLASLRKVLEGKLEYAQLSKDSIANPNKIEVAEKDIQPTEEELELRKKMLEEDKYNLFETAKPKVSQVLFSPAKGTILEPYNAKNKHNYLKIVVPQNTAIKAVAAGSVVFTDWTPNNGYVVLIRHQDGLLSIYKNAVSTTKNAGDIVKSGEVVALAGPTTQPKNSFFLFELWKDGFPTDPTQYINF